MNTGIVSPILLARGSWTAPGDTIVTWGSTQRQLGKASTQNY